MDTLRRYLIPVFALALAVAGCAEDEEKFVGIGNLRFEVSPKDAQFEFDDVLRTADDPDVEIVTEWDALNPRLRFGRSEELVRKLLEDHDLIFIDDVDAGRHVIEVSKEEFLTLQLPIVVFGGETKGIPVKLQGLIEVFVRSIPSRARLFLNGILQTNPADGSEALTPAFLREVPEDRYSFKLTKEGYFTADVIDTVRVDKTSFAFELLPLPIIKPLRFGTAARADNKPPSDLSDAIKQGMEADGYKVGSRDVKRPRPQKPAKVVFGVTEIENEGTRFNAFSFLLDESLGGKEFSHIAVVGEFEEPVPRFFQPAIRLLWNDRALRNKTFFPQIGKWDFAMVFDKTDFRNIIAIQYSTTLGTNMQAGSYRVEVIWDRRILQTAEFEIR